MKKGFSLIEIMVVVLIVAILGAIAVTQYQTAVDKSRFTALVPTAKALAEAQEMYHMNHGGYANNMSLLETNMEGATGDYATLSNGAIIEIGVEDEYRYVKATRDNLDNNYIVYQSHSQNYPGEMHCEALEGSSRAQKLCKNMGGREISGSLTDGYTTYILRGTGAGIPASFAHEMGEGNFQTCESYPCSKVCARNLPDGYECQGTYQEDHSYSEQVCKDGMCVTTSYDPNGKALSKSICQQDEESGVCKEVLKKVYDNNGNIIENSTGCIYNTQDGTCAAWREQIKKEYDEKGNLLHAEWLRNSNFTMVDEQGRIIAFLGGTFEVDQDGHLVITNQYGSQMGSYYSYGSSNSPVMFEYDEEGRVTRAIMQMGTSDKIITYEYGEDDKLKSSSTEQYGSQVHTTYEYNSEGNLTEISSCYSPTSCNRDKYIYENGRLVEEQHCYAGSTNCTTTKTYTYDADGHLESVSSSSWPSYTATYDENGNMKTKTDQYGSVTTYEYDEKGNLLSYSIVNANGNSAGSAHYEYDEQGRLISSSQTSAYGSGDVPTHYYYTEGSPSYVQFGSNSVSYSYTYDDNGNVIEKTQTIGYNLGATWSSEYTNTTSYTYDAEGNKISEEAYYTNYGCTTHTITGYENGNIVSVQYINPDGSVSTDYSYTYNDDGKLTGSQYTNSNFGYTSSYSWSYNEDGTLAQATSDGYTYTYTYENGVLTSIDSTNAQGNSTGHVTYENGKPVSVVSGGSTTTYTYNEDGTLASKITKDSSGKTTYSYTYGYDPEGHLTSTSYSSSWSNYTQNYTYTYEGDQIVSSTNNYGSTTHYTYNSEGQLASSTITNSAGNTLGTPTTYTYDENGYLISSTGGQYCYSNCSPNYSMEGTPPSVYMPNAPSTDVSWGVTPPGPVGCAMMGSAFGSNPWYE